MKKTKLIHQLKLTTSMFLIAYVDIFIGCVVIFSAVILGQLNEPTSSLKVNKEEASWIVSYLFIGPLMDIIGRKKALCFTYIPIMLSWLIFVYADSYYTILIGRVLQGFVISATPCTYVYAAEICRAEQRQLFTSIINLSVGVGMTFQCVLAMFFHWHTISVIMLAMSGVGCASLFLLQESPVWLRARGRVLQAETVERWYGLEPPAAAATVESVDRSRGDVDGPMSAASYWSVYAHRTVWKPTLILLTLFACMILSGLHVLITYSVYVLHGFNVQWDSIRVTALLCVARVLGSLFYSALHGVKRRTLFVVSSAGMTVSMVVILLVPKIYGSTLTNSVLVAAFFAYVFSSMFGVLPLPWILCGELFPRTVAGTMSSFVHICNCIMMFTIIKIYPILELNFGIYVIWSMFTIFCIISMLLGIFILPETQGKSLDEIGMTFEKRKKIANNN
ncbi:facilitated trehalose transporter Tret1-like isoform X2 [Sipha flava]|uniref:Facilitated trehalose transporter Tret1-like isoform X2 n=1 Tax=Sipha flava TaxID=143950 RepID=A0A8B8FF64_9HEMI|nr:facilitated trehalose transporter Tret1-like isoform X2 [Sipha flava]